ncbi:unnamed protein product [Moneuplotes crassus]|uniref:Uncharacterized protein n=1 Tax=Euplotes crassus TaxID=5936 RepID=A0AAD1X7Y3_EUPCR|nr:unnamed protein product [Moneuplotes crassus]
MPGESNIDYRGQTTRRKVNQKNSKTFKIMNKSKERDLKENLQNPRINHNKSDSKIHSRRHGKGNVRGTGNQTKLLESQNYSILDIINMQNISWNQRNSDRNINLQNPLNQRHLSNQIHAHMSNERPGRESLFPRNLDSSTGTTSEMIICPILLLNLTKLARNIELGSHIASQFQSRRPINFNGEELKKVDQQPLFTKKLTSSINPSYLDAPNSSGLEQLVWENKNEIQKLYEDLNKLRMRVTNLEMDRKCESPCPRLNQNKIRALSFSPAFNSVNTEKNEWKRYSRHLEGVIEQLLQKIKGNGIDHVHIQEGRNYEDFQNLDEFLLGDTHEQSNQKDNSFENQATNKMFETQEARGEFGRTETIKRKSESHRKKAFNLRYKDLLTKLFKKFSGNNQKIISEFKKSWKEGSQMYTPLDTKFIEDWIRKKRASSGMMIHKHPVNPLRWEEVKEHPCGEGQRQGSNPLQIQLEENSKENYSEEYSGFEESDHDKNSNPSKFLKPPKDVLKASTNKTQEIRKLSSKEKYYELMKRIQSSANDKKASKGSSSPINSFFQQR